MSKVGFIQDIIRGIRKVLDASKPSTTSADETNSSDTGVDPLLKRALIFLEDKDWDAADRYFDRILDMNPEFAPAYIGKLCVQLHYRFEEDLAQNRVPLIDNQLFNRALKYAKGDLHNKYSSYNQKIVDRIEEEKRRIAEENERAAKEKEEQRIRNELEKKEKQYLYALSLIEQKKNAENVTSISVNSIILSLREISDYKNVPELINGLKKRKAELEAIEKKRQEDKEAQFKQQEEWRSKGRCVYCGGKIALFSHQCSKCGKMNK
jgi:hypothetical protein